MCLGQDYSRFMRAVRLTAAMLLLSMGWAFPWAAQQDEVGRTILEERKAQAMNGYAEARHNLGQACLQP